MIKDLFSSSALQIKKARSLKHFDQSDFLHKKIADDLFSRLDISYFKNKKILLLGKFSQHTAIFTEANLRQEQITVIESGCLDELKVGLEFDIIISNLELHFINDIRDYFVRVKNKLVKDGVFLASMYGGNSLYELKNVFIEAAEKLGLDHAPRCIFFCDIKSVGMLMQQAGFTMPVVDSTNIKIKYKNIFGIISDLRAMAQTNILNDRPKNYVGKDFFQIANNIYQERFSINGSLLVNVDYISITGIRSD